MFIFTFITEFLYKSNMAASFGSSVLMKTSSVLFLTHKIYSL